MELEYVPVQVAMRREIARLSDEEAGRALKAILDYVATGEDVEPEGNAAFLYLALLRECDKICKIHEVRSAGGKAGGRGRPKKTKSEEIQQGTNEVLDEAKRQGFPDTTATMETLNQLVADNGTEEVLECVKIAGEAGKPNIRYLKGVINGRAKERQEEERQARIDAEKYPVVSSADYDYKPPSVTFGEVFKKYAKQRALEHPEERVKLEELAGRFS